MTQFIKNRTSLWYYTAPDTSTLGSLTHVLIGCGIHLLFPYSFIELL